jgi:uncharacterized membrane-anchored protein YhcB (DUF1043 family)
MVLFGLISFLTIVFLFYVLIDTEIERNKEINERLDNILKRLDKYKNN